MFPVYNRQKGIVLATTLLISTILLMLLICNLHFVSRDMMMTSISYENDRAENMAEVGINDALSEINRKSTNEGKEAVYLGSTSWKAYRDTKDCFYRYAYNGKYIFSEGAAGARLVGSSISGGMRKRLVANYIREIPTIAASEEITGLPDTFDAANEPEIVASSAIECIYSTSSLYPVDPWISCNKVAESVIYFGVVSPGAKFDIATAPMDGNARTYEDCLLDNDTKDKSGAFNLFVGLLFPGEDKIPLSYISEMDELIAKAADINTNKDVLGWELDVSDMKQMATDGSGPYSFTPYPGVPSDNTFTRSRLFLTRYNDIVVFNGDLILQNDVKLVFGGNVYVKGNILGHGSVIAMNSIVTAPTDVSWKTEYLNNDRLFLYANNYIMFVGKNVANEYLFAYMTMPKGVPELVAERCRETGETDFQQLLDEVFQQIEDDRSTTQEGDPQEDNRWKRRDYRQRNWYDNGVRGRGRGSGKP